MKYDEIFFDYVNSGSIRSAEVIVSRLREVLAVQSVLDVGCGAGAWLKAWIDSGVGDVTGIDGEYVEPEQLLIPGECFIGFDLEQPFDLGRRFDLAECLEVAEHLPEASADGLVGSLVRHADVVLFSAAVPGQGGDHHINEQALEYWRGKFARHGYIAIDYLRSEIAGLRDVEVWYRYNTLLYVRSDLLSALHPRLRVRAVEDDVALQEVAPFLYRIRRTLLRHLPFPIVTKLAKWKERAVLFARTHRTPGS